MSAMSCRRVLASMLLGCGLLGPVGVLAAEPALQVDCDVWIDLGEWMAQQVRDPDLAKWLAARDLECAAETVFRFTDLTSAQEDGCLLLEIDPVEALQLTNVSC